MQRERVIVAMSGGVDSSVGAGLEVERLGRGRVVGVYMKNWVHEERFEGDCPWVRDIEDARAVAERLGIEFRVVNLMEEYRLRVVDYLLKGYQEGITPNPDVMCNREIKFGVFLDYAKKEGFDAVATGHYARREQAGDSWDLLEGVDKNKDQSYFLALMRQEQIRGARFPVGGMKKADVRKKAVEYGFVNSGKKDSQGICFIGQIKMSDFLRQFVPDNPGDIVDWEGHVLGEHRGLHLYTLGQRRGLRVPSNRYGEAYVVVAKRPERNELVIAFDRPDSPGLYTREWIVGSLSWTQEAVVGERKILVRPRYRAVKVEARLVMRDEASADLIFDAPQRAVTPGQIAAFYEGEKLLGGGIFAAS